MNEGINRKSVWETKQTYVYGKDEYTIRIEVKERRDSGIHSAKVKVYFTGNGVNGRIFDFDVDSSVSPREALERAVDRIVGQNDTIKELLLYEYNRMERIIKEEA